MKERDRFEASLTDEGRSRLLLEAVTDYAIYMLDRDGHVVSWNPGAQRFNGFAAADIIGQHLSRFYTLEDRAKGLPAQALETTRHVGKFETEGWRVRKDGTAFWAHVTMNAIRDAQGELVGFAKITRDLTERRSAELTLQRSEVQFRVLVQNVTDYAIYMLDPSGIVTSWNLGAQRIKGYLPDQIIGEHFSRFYIEEDRAKGAPQLALATATRDGRFEKEGWRVRQDGTRFWANVVIDAIRDEHGTLIGFAKITRDITERRERQRQLDETREALFQSQKMEAIGQLTGGIAHDFNNLLMAVLGSLDRLRKRLPEDPQITPWLNNAVEAAQRGTTLTQRMLAFARRQELKPEAIDVPVLVRGMTNLLQRSLGPAVAIDTRFPLSLDGVYADANQLELALLNLAVNARDAMPQGGPIVIAARTEDVAAGNALHLAPGRYVCLSVTDTGEGMDEATLARATEPFFTTKGVGKGTGLGLSMVRGMSEQLGGTLALHSRKNAGTTAELWLPAVKIEAAAAATPARPAAGPDVGKLAILAVDDDRLVLMNTVAMLEDLGHSVLDAASGPRALEILRHKGAIDLVITDQAMPQMTGTQLADAIRAEWPLLPVILATGYAELPPEADRGLPKLSKPFGVTELERAIAETLRRPAESGPPRRFGTKS